ncbi:MAG: fibronectin type III domain-containing protein, partial [Deltaproteobacteria bacterium]|nr:fibronectin type III domain-containing protein [Deltaproteobacteria bacterium]
MVRRVVERIRGSVSQRTHVPSHTRRTGLVAGLLLGLCLCLPFSAWSVGGDISWQYDNVALNKQEAKAMAVDSQGNLVIVGYSAGAGNDYLVVKLKADGSGPLWTASYDSTGGGDVATAVVIDSNDDVIVTGYAWDGATYNDIYTVKYAAADGAVLWQHTFDGAGSGNDYATAITVDSINNVYVGGYMQDSNGKDSFIVLKYGPLNGPNPDGTPLWQASYDGGVNGHDRITAITAGVDGIAVTGQSQNATPDFDCFTIKYNFSGSEIWQRRYSDSGDGKGLALAMDAAGNVIMAGYVSNGSDRDFYVIEYAADDSPAKWVKIYDSGYDDEAADLWLDAAGDVYVVGTHASLMTGQDIYFARFDGGSGVEVWNGSYNSSNGDNDHGLFIVGDDNGELFIAGYNNDSASGFDDFLTLKLTRAAGTLLWAREYDGAGKNDRSVGAGLAPDGNLLIGGWSDRWTAGSSDYDFYALKYESGALNQPTALTATAVTNTQIDLSWVDNSTTEENFVVERKIGALGSYAVVATLAADSVSYSDSGLTADTRYYYRVMAYNAATGNSPYSDEANA